MVLLGCNGPTTSPSIAGQWLWKELKVEGYFRNFKNYVKVEKVSVILKFRRMYIYFNKL